MTAATKISLPEKSFSGSDIFRIWTIEVFADIPKQNNLSTLFEPISSKVKILTDFPFRAFIDQSWLAWPFQKSKLLPSIRFKEPPEENEIWNIHPTVANWQVRNIDQPGSAIPKLVFHFKIGRSMAAKVLFVSCEHSFPKRKIRNTCWSLPFGQSFVLRMIFETPPKLNPIRPYDS